MRLITCFQALHIKEEDIESSWAGVRPLIYEEGKNASEISRKDEIWVSKFWLNYNRRREINRIPQNGGNGGRLNR